ncbi:MAG: hypothetical protein HOY69_38600 [Streptomyces sp.]|nr:hypothetical protein [Streptomyces sp.]
MRTRHCAATLASAAILGLTLAACSSSNSGDDAKATTTPPATASATTSETAGSSGPAPTYTVYRNSGGGADMGIADLFLPDATEATARAAIQDFVHKNGTSVGYSVQVVRTKVAGKGFVCQGQWRKDSAAAKTYGGTVGLTITCPNP